MFGIEGIEIYFPKTYVAQEEYCTYIMTQRATKTQAKASTPKG